jgi:hypothetical protein
MAIVKLLGDSSGYVQLVANTAAQNNTLTLPNVNDTLANITSPTFYSTNSGVAMVIDANGNMGIGTSIPAYLLDVNGSARIGGSTSNSNQNFYINAGIQSQTTANWNFSNVNFIRNSSNTQNPRFIGMLLDGDSINSTTIGAYNAIWGSYNANPTTGSTSASLQGAMVYGAYYGHRWVLNGTEAMRITSTGNVGIGSTVTTVYDGQASGRPLVAAAASPSTTAGASTAALAVFNTDQTAENFAQINFGGLTPNSTNLYSSAIIAASVGPRVSGQYPTGNLIFMTSTTINFAPTEKLRITSQGNVGIGSSTPVQLLDVQGNVNVLNTVIMGSSFLRNRIINGAMQIDQRNAGASGTAISVVTVDRWLYGATQASKGTWGQNLNSVTLPSGFSNYLGFQSSSAYTVLAGDQFFFRQAIEGNNFYDFGFGTAAAKTITLSFVVYSSLTGTFSGSFTNYGFTRSYPFTYTISAANTWTTVYVTIPGDTGGTWVGGTNAGAALVWFSLGIGSTYTGPASAWATASYAAATGATSVVGTSGATFYITGVQLEQGPVATPFERRLYGTELSLCQRYYWINSSATNSVSYYMPVFAYSTTLAFGVIEFPVTMRTTPTISTTGTPANYRIILGGTAYALTGGPAIDQATPYSSSISFTTAGTLTVGQAGMAGANSSTAAFLGFNAEL